LTELGGYGAEVEWDCIEKNVDEWLSRAGGDSLALLLLLLIAVPVRELEEEVGFSPALTRQTSMGPQLLRKNSSYRLLGASMPSSGSGISNVVPSNE
jgi:hypothetical protein